LACSYFVEPPIALSQAIGPGKSPTLRCAVLAADAAKPEEQVSNELLCGPSAAGRPSSWVPADTLAGPSASAQAPNVVVYHRGRDEPALGAALPLRGVRLSELERSCGRLVRRARCDWCGPFVWPMPLPPGPASACLRRPAECALVAATQVPVVGLRRPASSRASTRKAARPFLRRCGVGVILPTSAPQGEELGAAHIGTPRVSLGVWAAWRFQAWDVSRWLDRGQSSLADKNVSAALTSDATLG